MTIVAAHVAKELPAHYAIVPICCDSVVCHYVANGTVVSAFLVPREPLGGRELPMTVVALVYVGGLGHRPHPQNHAPAHCNNRYEAYMLAAELI